MEAEMKKGHDWQAVTPMQLEAEMRLQDSTKDLIPSIPCEVVPLVPYEAPPTPPAKPLNPDTKCAAVLRVFLERGERGLNCFEAVREAHDYVLRSTVSKCSRHHGIQFAKRFEKVPGHAGSNIDCIRYSLTAESAGRVRELLGERMELAA